MCNHESNLNHEEPLNEPNTADSDNFGMVKMP